MNTAAVFSGSSAIARLGELDLDLDIIQEALQRGLFAWASCTHNHPLMYPGFRAWAETVCALRDRLVVLGWDKSDEGGLPLVTCPSGAIAISVSTGDEFTGLEQSSPSTKATKGPKTIDLVAMNQIQAALFPTDEFLPVSDVSPSEKSTWILLFHRDTYSRQLRAELSLPVAIGTDGRVDNWIERIIIPITDFGDDLVGISSDTGTSTPNLNVEIRKRA